MVAIIITPRVNLEDALKLARNLKDQQLNPDRILHSPDGQAPETGRILGREFSNAHQNVRVPVEMAEQLNPTGRSGDIIEVLAGQNAKDRPLVVTHPGRIYDIAREYLDLNAQLEFATRIEKFRPGEGIEFIFENAPTWNAVRKKTGTVKFIPELDPS